MTKNRTNILICRSIDGVDHEGKSLVGNCVQLRDGYRAYDPPTALFVDGQSVYDEAATNNLGTKGAFVVRSDIAGIEAAVATLRAQFGPVPVQDNSGKCGHLSAIGEAQWPT